MNKGIHVVSNSGDWLVRVDNRTISAHHSRQVAIERAHKIAKKRREDVIVHALDGRVVRTDIFAKSRRTH